MLIGARSAMGMQHCSNESLRELCDQVIDAPLTSPTDKNALGALQHVSTRSQWRPFYTNNGRVPASPAPNTPRSTSSLGSKGNQKTGRVSGTAGSFLWPGFAPISTSGPSGPSSVQGVLSRTIASYLHRVLMWVLTEVGVNIPVM